MFFEELLGTFPTIELTGDPLRIRSNLNNGLKELPVRLARVADHRNWRQPAGIATLADAGWLPESAARGPARTYSLDSADIWLVNCAMSK